MKTLVILAALSGTLAFRPSVSDFDKVKGPPQGTWRVLEVIDGPASALAATMVQISGKRLVLTQGEEKLELLIVGINPTKGIGTIDLRDKYKRIFRGIYHQDGKRLSICVQFWTEGNAKESIRPQSFLEADRTKVFGPTMYVLEQK